MIFSVSLSLTIILILFYGVQNEFFIPLLVITLYSLFISLFYKRFLTMELILKDEFIYFKNNKKELKIKYNEIEKITTVRFSDFGGYMTIQSKNDKIQLTISIKNITDFIEKLKTKLKDENMDYLINEEKFKLFYKTSLFVEDSFRRTKYLLLAAIYFLVVFIVSFVFDSYKDGALIGSSFLILMYYLIGYILVEYVVFKKDFNKKFENPSFNKNEVNNKKEKSVFLYLLITSFLIHLIVVLLIELFV
jgi:hypothetical protein